MSATYQGIVDKYLNVVLDGGVEVMAQCPLCDGEASLQFNLEKGLFVCFRCGVGGTAKRLVKLIGGSYSDPHVSIEVLQGALDNLKVSGKQKPPVILDESYLARYIGDSPDGYWEERGFDEETRERWGLGYDPLTDRCTIAYRNSSGELLGIIQRRLDDIFPRYLYPKGFDRSGSLFGSWEISDGGSRAAVLVEGSTDVIKLDKYITHDIPLAQYGSSITARQIKLLRRLGIREVILFYDYDEAGRKAEQQALEVLDGFIVRIPTWNEDRYCYHKKLCGCGKHDWKTISQCKFKIFCRCGRRHNVDPGQLKGSEIKQMIYLSQLAGKRQSKWDILRSAKSKVAQKKRMGG